MFQVRKIGEAEVEYASNLPVKHLFSTRYGGFSQIPFLSSMNVGENRGDSEENVQKNYQILLSFLDTDRDHAVVGGQIHSTTIRYVTEADGGSFFLDTDGFITDRKGIALVVKVADCVPILLSDPKAGVIAALHAGWRGSALGIACRGIERMVQLGADPEQIVVAIGPCIHACCYEVGEDFRLRVEELLGDEICKRFLKSRGDKLYADLPELNRQFLLASHVKKEHIDISPACTCCHPDRYFSHRASHGKRGTMAAMIVQ